MTSWWQKTRATAADLSGLLGGTLQLLTKRALPPSSGTITIAALHAPVEIITDRYGVPHIYAQNEDDLYFAQGYVHAKERLWQLEVGRRLGAGRLSELVGPAMLDTDRFMRRLGMHRAAQKEAEHLNAEASRVIDAYVNGMNTYIDTIKQNSKRLPVEFTILRIELQPFTRADVLQWGKVQGWSLSGNWETELIRARLVGKLGAERAAQLEAGYDANHPLIVPPGVAYQGINLGLLEQYQQISALTGLSTMGGSNNWVVDGTQTESGAPMLCNDPHLGQMIPSIWFECHLVGGEIDVTGVSFPGAPGVIIGHNQHIAWGVTNAVSDVQDLYMEKFNPDNPRQYEFVGQWEEAEIIREEILVRGQDVPVVEEVRVTRHGPIITHMPPVSQKQANSDPATHEPTEIPLALRWTGLEQEKISTSVIRLNKARNWDEFKEALHYWDVPPQNFVYADTEGNIGYVLAGAIPIRAQGQALVPVPGWSGEYEWVGTIPFDELPQTYNPEQHFIVTANNRVVDDSYPYYITHEWLNGYRAQRISDLLTKGTKLNASAMAAIQTDQYALPALAILPYILDCEADTPIKRSAHEILRAWDYQLTPESIAACIYTTFEWRLERIVLDAVIGDDEALLNNYLGGSLTTISVTNGYKGRFKPLLIRLLKEQDEQWFANSALPNGPTNWKTALNRAFAATIEELSARLGSNILNWHYGTLHTMTYTHPLGNIKALQGFFNRGPFPVGGDNDTVNVAVNAPGDPSTVTTVASYRQIVDLHDLGASQSIHAPGQSGQPGSPHYDDFIPLWRAGNYHPMLYTRSTIEQAAEGTFYLTPQPTLMKK